VAITSPSFRIIAGVVALLAAHGAASAVDRGEINDVRASYAIVPDWDVDGGGEIDGGHRISVQGMRQFTAMTDRGGWIWGAEGALQLVDDISAVIVSATALGGYAYQLPQMQSIHFEGTPYLGLGIADLGDSSDNTEIYVEYGLRAAGFWTFDAGWQVGLDLRLQRSDADAIDNSGLQLGIVGGYRF
jgi:hypothetical protein